LFFCSFFSDFNVILFSDKQKMSQEWVAWLFDRPVPFTRKATQSSTKSESCSLHGNSETASAWEVHV
jgi:hypothetical protein